VSPDEVIGVEDADDVCVDPNDDVLAGEEPRDAVSGGREDDPAVAVVPKRRSRILDGYIGASSRRQLGRANERPLLSPLARRGRGRPPGAHPPPILSAAD
jgi:hypothetical protein